MIKVELSSVTAMPFGKCELVGDLTHDPVWGDRRDEAGRDAFVGVEVVAAVDVDGAAAINHDLVEIAGQATEIDMINQRAIGLLPQQSLFLAGNDQQPAVWQPIDRERDRAGHLGDHLTMALEVVRENLRGTPVRQPQRGRHASGRTLR